MPVRDYKMHGATPTGRSRAYTNYTTIRKVKDTRLSVSAMKVEEQMMDLLRGIQIDPHVIPQLQRQCRKHIDALKEPNAKEHIVELGDRLEQLHVEEPAG